MKSLNLMRKQLEEKMEFLQPLKTVSTPGNGWIQATRQALGMSLRQLAVRLGITSQSIHDMELREKSGMITINSMRQIASGMQMDFYYCFLPQNHSLKKMIEDRARELAKQIVYRTHQSMKIEDQSLKEEMLNAVIEEKINEFKQKIPRNFWD